MDPTGGPSSDRGLALGARNRRFHPSGSVGDVVSWHPVHVGARPGSGAALVRGKPSDHDDRAAAGCNACSEQLEGPRAWDREVGRWQRGRLSEEYTRPSRSRQHEDHPVDTSVPGLEGQPSGRGPGHRAERFQPRLRSATGRNRPPWRRSPGRPRHVDRQVPGAALRPTSRSSRGGGAGTGPGVSIGPRHGSACRRGTRGRTVRGRPRHGAGPGPSRSLAVRVHARSG